MRKKSKIRSLILALGAMSAASAPAATFSDANWTALGPGMNGGILALVLSGTNLYAGGYFTNAGGVAANYIAAWNGSSWSPLGSGVSGGDENGPWVEALAVSGDTLYVGGDFTNAGGASANYVAQWNGSSWSALGTGMNGAVKALAVLGTNLYAGGQFSTAGGISANNIAQWNGNSWSALGSGLSGGYYRIVWALAPSGNTLYAGGQFMTAGGIAATNIAQWDGGSWSALGSGISDGGGGAPIVYALAVSGTNLYAGGAFSFATAGGVSANCIARWNGNSWSALGSGMRGGEIYALTTAGDTLYAGGWFLSAGDATAFFIAQWDGNAWSALGSGLNSIVYALGVPGGPNLYAGGAFTMAGTNVSAYVAEALFSESSYDLSLTNLGSGTNVITGLGTPGYAYALDMATNLAPPIVWMPQATNTPVYQSFAFTNVSASPQGYYRTRYVAQ